MKLIPLFFLILVTTLALLMGAVFAYSRLSGRRDSSVRIDVAVAGGNGDAMTEKALILVQQMEVIRSITRFHRTSREEADRKVRDGTYDAAIYLNDNMYEDINQGRNTPVLIRTADRATFESELFRELVSSGIRDLQTAEASIYAVYDMSARYPTAGSTGSLANRMAKQYIRLFLSRGVLFEDALLAPYGEMTGPEFAAVTFLLMLPLILGCGCAAFYGRGESQTGILLNRAGVPLWFQSASRMIVMTAVIWLFMMLTAGALASVRILEGAVFFRPAVLLAASFGTAAYIHLVFSVLSGESGSCLYLIATVSMIVLGGGFFPSSFMPAPLARLSGIMPFAWWQRVLSGMVRGQTRISAALAAAGGSVLLILAAEAVGALRRRGGVR